MFGFTVSLIPKSFKTNQKGTYFAASRAHCTVCVKFCLDQTRQHHPQNDPCKLPHDPSITSGCQVKEGAEVKAIIIKTGTWIIHVLSLADTAPSTHLSPWPAAPYGGQGWVQCGRWVEWPRGWNDKSREEGKNRKQSILMLFVSS